MISSLGNGNLKVPLVLTIILFYSLLLTLLTLFLSNPKPINSAYTFFQNLNHPFWNKQQKK